MKTMEPRAIGGLSDIEPKQRASSRSAKRGERFDGLAHDIINQLTVISLSCSQIRTAAGTQRPPHVGDIDCIEKAVTQMAQLVATWRQRDMDLLKSHLRQTQVA